MKATRKFTRGDDRKAIKVLQEELYALEKEGIIKIYTPDTVKEMMKNHSSKQIRKDANNVYSAMNKNNEILIEGQIPGNIIERVK